MDDFRRYLNQGPGGLIERLAEVVTELAGLSMEYATVLVGEKRAKVTAFHHSDETTVTGRERWAEYQALDLTVAAIEVRGQMQALEYERDLLLTLLAR